jgi:hypothetical protein
LDFACHIRKLVLDSNAEGLLINARDITQDKKADAPTSTLHTTLHPVAQPVFIPSVPLSMQETTSREQGGCSIPRSDNLKASTTTACGGDTL